MVKWTENINGEPYTSRGVRTVRGRVLGNPITAMWKGAGCLAYIIYNRVSDNGKTIPDKFQRLKNIKISKELTLKHGMHIGQGKEKVNRQQLKGIDKLKYELYDTIKKVSQRVTSMVELKQELLKHGIGTQFKYKSGTLEKQGISFSKGDYKFKGSEIDRSLSYGRLNKQIEPQAQQKQAEQQRPPLAQQLRGIIDNTRAKEQSGHQSTVELMGHIPIITPEREPDPYRRKKRKGYGQDNDQDQSQGISR
jgi:hypothetical protein